MFVSTLYFKFKLDHIKKYYLNKTYLKINKPHLYLL